MLDLKVQAEKYKRVGPRAEIQPLTRTRKVRNAAAEFSETTSAIHLCLAQASAIDFLICA